MKYILGGAALGAGASFALGKSKDWVVFTGMGAIIGFVTAFAVSVSSPAPATAGE